MPYATPNRVNNPVQLEQFVDPSNIVQWDGLFCHYFNQNTTTTILMGEPVVFGGKVWLAQKPILPQEYGTIVSGWVAHFLLDPDHTGDINQGDTIYWDLEIDAVTAYGSSTVLAGIGAASATQPTEGFILGYAVGNREIDLGVDGSNNLLCGKTGSIYVPVVSLPGATTLYSA
jgi:predicted RecA/RadA family phage recombinase